MGDSSKEPRKQFGNRYLTEADNVFKHNAWDDVKWDEEQERLAFEKVQENSAKAMPSEQISKYIDGADSNWDAFYNIHQNKFFKDRHWLFTEFPELNASHRTSKLFNIFEIGCGVGNTILPILKYNNDDNVQVYGCDFSSRAIEILRTSEEFDSNRCQVFVLDATKESWQEGLPFNENSMDIIAIIFVLSAIKPEK